MKSWKLQPLGQGSLQDQLLANRGIITPEAKERFLKPNYLRDIYDPFLLKGVTLAVERILQAITSDEKIVIFGDYDADGVPGTAVLASAFKKLGYKNFDIYLPDRYEESYGLSQSAVEKIAAGGARLIITIDCGITAIAEVRHAKALGVEVIITDHHLAPAELPEVLTIVNPKQPGETYSFDMLCGAGVAYKLTQGLIREWDKRNPAKAIGLNWEKTLLDLVGVATVSDMVPLVDENRALAYFGLKMLRLTTRLGFTALFSTAQIKREYLTEDDIGFSIGPRINSASRMSHASEAYNLLTTESLSEATKIAQHLELKNKERKGSVEHILTAVEAETALSLERPSLLVVGGDDWSLGVLGLAASRLVDKFSVPVFVWGKNSRGEVKGSCRSDGVVNVVELMRSVNEGNFFADLGGHAMAGGFTLAPGRETELKTVLVNAYSKMELAAYSEEIVIDASLSLDDVNEVTYEAISALAPFGIGNSKPVFVFNNISLTSAKTFGNGGIHLELCFKNSEEKKINAVGFFLCPPGERGEFDATNGHRFQGVVLKPGNKLNLLATFEKSYFKYKPELRLRIIDIQPVDNI